MKISVTEDDVKKGQRYKPQDCPIALAARRSIPNKVIIVGTEHLSVYDPGDWLASLATWSTPR